MSRHPPPVHKLVRQLGDEIAHGFEHGERFWSIRQLMERFGISSSLAQKAISQLVGQGALRSEPRSGTYVVKAEAARQRTVAFVYGEWQSPFGDALHFAVFNGAAETIAEAGLALHYLVLRPGDPASLALAAAFQADGVILSSRLDGEVVDAILARGLPTVAYRTARPGADAAVSDYAGGACQAVLHLAGLGHRRIAMLRAERNYYDEWYAGYRQGLAEADLPYRPELVWSMEETTRLLAALAIDGVAPRGATAAFLPNDSTAWQLIHDTGVRVPEQLSVVGFEDRDPSGWQRPRLTTLAIHPHQLGQEAARCLLERLRGHLEAPPRQRIVPVSLVIRDSTRPLTHAEAAHAATPELP